MINDINWAYYGSATAVLGVFLILRGRWGYRRNGWIGRLGLELLVAYESRTHYRPRFDFYGIARRSMPKIVSAEMNKAIARALQTRN